MNFAAAGVLVCCMEAPSKCTTCAAAELSSQGRRRRNSDFGANSRSALEGRESKKGNSQRSLTTTWILKKKKSNFWRRRHVELFIFFAKSLCTRRRIFCKIESVILFWAKTMYVGPSKKWHLRPPSKREGGPLSLLHARSLSRNRLLDRGGVKEFRPPEGFAPGTPARWTLPPVGDRRAVSAQKAREIQKISASRLLRSRRPRRLRRGPRVYRGKTNDLMNTFCQYSVHHYSFTTHSYVKTTLNEARARTKWMF